MLVLMNLASRIVYYDILYHSDQLEWPLSIRGPPVEFVKIVQYLQSVEPSVCCERVQKHKPQEMVWFGGMKHRN